VDRGQAQDSAARGDAQQPRLPPGGDARAAPFHFRNRVANLGGDMGRSAPASRTRTSSTQARRKHGWWAKGPIKDPAQLGAALREAVKVVQAGQPACSTSGRSRDECHRNECHCDECHSEFHTKLREESAFGFRPALRLSRLAAGSAEKGRPPREARLLQCHGFMGRAP